MKAIVEQFVSEAMLHRNLLMLTLFQKALYAVGTHVVYHDMDMEVISRRKKGLKWYYTLRSGGIERVAEQMDIEGVLQKGGGSGSGTLVDD